MPSMFEQSMMLDALDRSGDHQFPRGMQALREEAARDPDKWRWCIEEAKRRQALATWETDRG